MEQPKNIFEQLMLGQRILNDNIIQMSDNLNALYDRLESMLSPVKDTLQPTALGNEEIERNESHY